MKKPHSECRKNYTAIEIMGCDFSFLEKSFELINDYN